MATDLKRLFANLTYNPKPGTGSTYALIYQAFGECLQGRDLVLIVLPVGRPREYLFHEIQDIARFRLGVGVVRVRNGRNVDFKYKGRYFSIQVMYDTADLNRCMRGLASDVPVFHDH